MSVMRVRAADGLPAGYRVSLAEVMRPETNYRGNEHGKTETHLHHPFRQDQGHHLTANQSANGIWYSVQVCRIYKDGDEWKQTDSLGRDDLLLACKALDEAHTWIYQQAQSGRSAGATGGTSTMENAEEG